MCYDNIAILFSKTGNGTVHLTVEYLTKLKELKGYIGKEQSLLHLEQWSEQRDIEFIEEKLEGMKGYSFSFQCYKLISASSYADLYDHTYIVKHMVEYSYTHQSFCRDDYVTTREAIFKIFHLFPTVIHSVSFPIIDAMSHYAFKNSLKQTHIIYFKSVKQVFFTVKVKICKKCDRQKTYKLFLVSMPIVFYTLQYRRTETLSEIYKHAKINKQTYCAQNATFGNSINK